MLFVTANSVDVPGPGGAIVARRLAEIESNQVLLLEAGGDPPASSDLAANLGTLPEDALWNFATSPSNGECRGFKRNSCLLRTAKVQTLSDVPPTAF